MTPVEDDWLPHLQEYAQRELKRLNPAFNAVLLPKIRTYGIEAHRAMSALSPAQIAEDYLRLVTLGIVPDHLRPDDELVPLLIEMGSDPEGRDIAEGALIARISLLLEESRRYGCPCGCGWPQGSDSDECDL